MRRTRIHPSSSTRCLSQAKVMNTWQDVSSAGKALSRDQQELVQTSWQVLSQDLEGFGCQVLNRLEQLCPDAYHAYTSNAPISDVTSDYSSSIASNTLISASASYSFLQQPCGIAAFRCHAKRTMETYGMVVFGLEEMEDVYPLLKSTGRRLARRGVQPQHVHALSCSMLGTVQQVFISEWCVRWHAAWSSLAALVEYGQLAGIHTELAATVANGNTSPPLYLPLSPATPEYRSLSSPSVASSWSSASGSSLSSFSLSPNQSLASTSASFSASSASSYGSGDDSPPNKPRDLSWATSRPSPQAWPALDDSALPPPLPLPASQRNAKQSWCVNIPALLRANKKHRRRSDPVQSKTATAAGGRQTSSSVPKWLARSPMLRSKFNHDSAMMSSSKTQAEKRVTRSSQYY